jgi:hypothetical protein
MKFQSSALLLIAAASSTNAFTSSLSNINSRTTTSLNEGGLNVELPSIESYVSSSSSSSRANKRHTSCVVSCV